MTEEEWQHRLVRVPKGTHLSKSRATPGAERDLLREDGTNKNLGPAESIAADEYADYNVDARAYGSQRAAVPLRWQVAAELFQIFVDAVPWDYIAEEVVVPAINRKLRSAGQRLRGAFARNDDETGPNLIAQHPAEEAHTPQFGGHEEPPIVMSQEEYRQTVISIMAADAYTSQQRERLARTRIKDGLTPELTHSLRLILEGRIVDLTESDLAALMHFLQGPETGNDARALLSGEGGDAPSL